MASELGFSIRQLYRLEVAALQTLSATLAAHTTRVRFAGTPDTNETSAYNDSAGAEQEFDLLKISPSEIIETIPFIESVLQTTAPLSKSLGLRINFSQPARLPSIYGKLVPLRQGIINVLTAVAQKIPGGQITLELTPEEQFINLVLTAVPQMNEMNSSEDQLAESYHLALRLIELSGGSMKVVQQSAGQPGLTLQIFLPLSGSHLVLAVDDNLDAFRLIERYLVDSPYRLEELQDPTQLIATAEALKPSAILLDVMLPGTDGWELLGRLREHPSLGQIPVIICTILPQESLALSLGATAFLRKPIKQESLLQTLDNLVSPREIRSS